MEHGAVLIVEDRKDVARAIARYLLRDLTLRFASCARSAIAMLREHVDWVLLLIDVSLGADSSGLEGLDVLEVAIAEHPRAVRALITGNDSAYVNNYARARSTDVIRKPFAAEEIAPTLARVRAARGGQLALESLAALAHRVRLSDREQEVIGRLVSGERRSDLPTSMKVAKTTLDTFMRGILAKTGEENVHEVVHGVMRSAIKYGA